MVLLETTRVLTVNHRLSIGTTCTDHQTPESGVSVCSEKKLKFNTHGDDGLITESRIARQTVNNLKERTKW
jgi:hypothetical protein